MYQGESLHTRSITARREECVICIDNVCERGVKVENAALLTLCPLQTPLLTDHNKPL